MKKYILSLIAAFAAVSSLQAHCGTCSVGDDKSHDHASVGKCSDAQLSHYYETQAALAGDDLAAAKEGAEGMLAHAEDMGCAADGKSCCNKEIAAAEKIAEAESIAEAREGFREWSETLMAKIEENGVQSGEVYRMECPMAFNNEGAGWLQPSAMVHNPYFGASMLACGMQKNKYTGED